MTRILIAEDEPRIAAFLQKGLQAHGFTTTVADDGVKAAYLARSDDFELLILDLGLPAKHGTLVIQELRGRGESLPIIILTVIQDIKDKVKALEAGADDYLTKPFSLEELIARIRVQLRHQRSPRTSEKTVLRAGDLVLDLRQRKVQFKEKPIELSTREFTLLEILARQPGQVWTREDLLDQVWGYDYDPTSNIVDVYVGYLRKKIGRGLIKTVRGMGYRLQV
ncbi:response regulator transcription factor [Chlorogloeopsis sp. ULAP01]|uniref:response regulator transcription factor n=1 Tax=Chlorogloeopsis sp. ULAP01 TaxID=3056483 RepID=UPI0025AA4BE1|nr:response regulator transcription factor [Chlorogloeopsis sp. ULAP01]MDM9382253.1 response regulator transcription factor [Chlorogloeopsis sp. ULAP01]